jgi:hypothetical protein
VYLPTVKQPRAEPTKVTYRVASHAPNETPFKQLQHPDRSEDGHPWEFHALGTSCLTATRYDMGAVGRGSCGLCPLVRRHRVRTMHDVMDHAARPTHVVQAARRASPGLEPLHVVFENDFE